MLAAVKNRAAITEFKAINNGYKNINNISAEQQTIGQLCLLH
jgi:hypothetical protein